MDLSGMPNDFEVDCYLLKIIASKSKRNSSQHDVQSFIALTSDQNLVCIQVIEKGLLLQAAFPKENTYIRVSNINFVNCTRISNKDLSFEIFDSAVTTLADEENNYFVYDNFKFTCNSQVKQSTPTSSDNMRTLKLLVKEASVMKQIKRKVRHIVNQGITSRLTQEISANEKSL